MGRSLSNTCFSFSSDTSKQTLHFARLPHHIYSLPLSLSLSLSSRQFFSCQFGDMSSGEASQACKSKALPLQVPKTSKLKTDRLCTLPKIYYSFFCDTLLLYLSRFFWYQYLIVVFLTLPSSVSPGDVVTIPFVLPSRRKIISGLFHQALQPSTSFCSIRIS